MIQMQTTLDVADNTGAKSVQCFKVLGGSKRKQPNATVEVDQILRIPKLDKLADMRNQRITHLWVDLIEGATWNAHIPDRRAFREPLNTRFAIDPMHSAIGLGPPKGDRRIGTQSLHGLHV